MRIKMNVSYKAIKISKDTHIIKCMELDGFDEPTHKSWKTRNSLVRDLFNSKKGRVKLYVAL